MSKIKTFILSALFLFSLKAFSQFEFIEKVEQKPGEIIIPYEKYKLTSNDLTLIIHEDHSDPIVHVQIAYHVGSARESVRNSGFAHFFEHMMFQGSKNVADEEHFKMISKAGGTCNAFTSFDKTVYINTAPSNFTETLLWMEADRMSSLLEGFTKEKFESQRNAVKNEKKQSYDNQPYGMVSEVLFKTLFANQSSYEWTPIGFTDDLDIASFEDLRRFFLKWYKPNNATIVVSGDVNPEEVKEWVNKYYGTIAKGKTITKPKKVNVILPYDQYVEIKDNIYLPLTMMVWPTVPEFNKDEVPLTLLSYILSGNNSSPFYKKFVKTEDAVQASAGHSSLELAGFFSVDVVGTYGGLSTKEIEKKIRETLAEFDKNGCSNEELEKAKVVYKTNIIDVMDGVSSKALSLSHWNMMLNKKYNINDEIDAFNRVTKDDIMRVFRTYIKDKYAVIINVVPDPEERDTSISKSVNPHANEEKIADPQYNGLTYTPVKDNFDRSLWPTVKPNKPVTLPDVYEFKLTNDLKVIGTKTSETPKVIVQLNIEGGQLLETGKYPTGTTQLLASLLTEGTKDLTSEQFQNELDKMGSSISFYAGQTQFSCYLTSTKENIEKTLKLFEGVLLSPRFESSDFKRIKKQMLESVQSLKKNPSAMAEIAFQNIMFKGTLLEDDNSGNFKSVSKIKLDDVKEYFNNNFAPNVSSLIITGDLSDEEARKYFDFLNKWNRKELTIPSLGNMPEPEKVQIYLIDKPYAPQSVIMVTQKHIPYDYNGDYFKSTVMYYPLGGSFNSRLTLNIREKHGFAYSPQSAFSGNKYYGFLMWRADVRTNATDSAIREVMYEISNFKSGGITDEELDYAKKSLLAADALKYESPGQKAGFLGRVINYNLPKNFSQEQMKIINNLTKDEINEIAKKVLHPETMTIIVVGHAYKIREKLNKLGYGKIKEIKID
ncbi:MAG: insulinase family protein [Bacteroidetes bacterium]|nr:insulinase family protein [Bacteroidota bacterium]